MQVTALAFFAMRKVRPLETVSIPAYCVKIIKTFDTLNSSVDKKLIRNDMTMDESEYERELCDKLGCSISSDNCFGGDFSS